MKRRLTVVAAAACFLVSVANAQNEKAVTPDRQAVLSKYCFGCHNQKLKSGGLALSALDLTSLSKDNDTWEKVVRKVRTGAMPP